MPKFFTCGPIPDNFEASLFEHMAQIWVLGFDCGEIMLQAKKTLLDIGGTGNQVPADSFANTASALNHYALSPDMLF